MDVGQVSIVVVIPAFEPGDRLLDILSGLSRAGLPVVVVNDGSSEGHQAIFRSAAALPHVEVIEHAVNLGKGAALRTGFNHALCKFRDACGIVTADADGQHPVDDILRVASEFEREPHKLVLGVREFRGAVPLRSRIGNQMTRLLFRAVHGQALRDTQTGLRGVPRALAEAMLKSPASGYEFELDMLICARQLDLSFLQVDIQTVYLDGNASSHFNPLLDSMRIYFLLLRFSAASLMTAVCDNLVFYLTLLWLGMPLPAQIAGRLAAVLVNFNLNRRMVFLFRENGASAIGRYLTVVAASGVISYLSLISLHRIFDVPLLSAKIAVECVLFLANFAVLRDFVFVSKKTSEGATDWTTYYQKVPWTAPLTRKYTIRCILSALRRAGFGQAAAAPEIFEFGGGNSCFLDPIAKTFSPASYHIMDTNPLGLELLRRRDSLNVPLVLHQQNVMEMEGKASADIVFSVGLVEHFDAAGTARCIQAHFESARHGGWVLISFPTATWLYRATRSLLEVLRIWQFPDERPLSRAEVAETGSRYGTLLWEKTLWPLCLTQHMMLFQRLASGDSREQSRPLPVLGRARAQAN